MIYVAVAIFAGLCLVALAIYSVFEGQPRASNRIAARLDELVQEFDTLKITFSRIASLVEFEVRHREDFEKKLAREKYEQERREIEAGLRDGTVKQYRD